MALPTDRRRTPPLPDLAWSWYGETFRWRTTRPGEDWPPTRQTQDDGHWRVELHLPDYREENLNVMVAAGVVTVTGDAGPAGAAVVPTGFRRTFRLPPEAEPDRVSASFGGGILTVDVPLAPDADGTRDHPAAVMTVAPRRERVRARLVREAEAGGEAALAELLGEATDAPFVEREAIHGVGRMIRRLREGQGMTQQVLADAAGTTTAQVSLVERGLGARGPGVGLLARLLDALGYELTFAAPD